MARIPLMFLLVLYLFPTKQSLACGNEYFNTIEMPLHKDSLLLNQLLLSPGDSDHPYWWNGFGENIIIKRDSLLKALSKQIGRPIQNSFILYKILKNGKAEMADYKLVSDFAWYELRVGNKSIAVSLLELLYTKHADEYNILANLGTAYEVTGNNQKALELLQKAIAVNPQSHVGSEWIHIKILEQKNSAAPDYTKIINLGSKNFEEWLIDRKYSFPQNPDSLKKQIAYQLHERISFIKPPDAIIAQLVLDFADIVARHDGHVAAAPFYEYADNYGSSPTHSIVESRKKILTKTRQEIKTTFNWASVVWAFPLIVFVLVFIAWIRNRRNQATQ